jgi:hypothetical protein
MKKQQKTSAETAPAPGNNNRAEERTAGNGGRMIAPALATAAVLVAAIGLSQELLMHESPSFQIMPARQRAAGEPSKAPVGAAPLDHFADKLSLPGARRKRQKGKEVDLMSPKDSGSSHVSGSALDTGFESGSDDREHGQTRLNEIASELASVEGRLSESLDSANSVAYDISVLPEPQFEVEYETPVEEIFRSQAPATALLSDRDGELNAPGKHEQDEVAQSREIEFGRVSQAEAKLLKTEQAWKQNSGSKTHRPDRYKSDSLRNAGAYTNAGFDFLTHYQQTGNLQTQPASGYWANTYIPGDPEIRLLSARLAQWDRSWLEDNVSLEQAVEPVTQPFDAPADNALALSLMTDAAHIAAGDRAQGPTRMRLQVGIRGIEHRRGQRPAMNVGVVVDLPADAPDELRIATRALLDALLQSKQAGDRFSLVMTGRHGQTHGLVVPADEFRFGSLQLVKSLILGQDSAPVDDSLQPSPRDSSGFDLSRLDLPSLDLYGAMQKAGAMVQETDDPSRPLGSSSVLLISAREIQDIERLTALTHAQAKEGITLSVLPLGSEPQNDHVEKLVLAGLGNRRYLEAPSQARQLIEEELHASSRAVARAARLSIRLAPGVRLIDVVGSQRLDIERAQRVREIENSMDRRLSANLGIQADRGEDEDGIQILIPSIFSGDNVVVLLDLVSDRPGAIADVSLRYKDLVFLRNGSLRGHLELPGGPLSGAEPVRGPAELAVLKNLLSHHFVDAVEQAAAALGRQQTVEAARVLGAMRATIEQARQELPAWAHDPDIIRDQQVLDRYLTALASSGAGSHQEFLTDSLRYAAWAKAHRPLEEWKQ